MGQRPGLPHLAEQLEGRGLHPSRMVAVDLELALEGRDRALAHVLVAAAAHHLVDHTLAQGVVRYLHVCDAEGVEHGM